MTYYIETQQKRPGRIAWRQAYEDDAPVVCKTGSEAEEAVERQLAAGCGAVRAVRAGRPEYIGCPNADGTVTIFGPDGPRHLSSVRSSGQ